ncbi:hypothetical protein Poli38472_008714 [Pythium oligandrum]|uniref:peptidylprolyl isomerase n=1 Tax=Pythium oligandrum TaxID=41045 RepID=A0A8K1C428_PYTOL|nr:hypothetical protein Poli38472_008714 [Pythium oligandrum]|eukprot:TMW56066.1 hypothetical protein Poli38472_008714 [Pythium oligandrum]
MKFAVWTALAALALAVSPVQSAKDLPGDAELGIKVVSRPESCDQESAAGDMVSVHYTGKLLKTGAKFDSSVDRNTPFEFKLGAGEVIEGWDQGVEGMCVGEKRQLTVPSGLGYGSNGFPPIIPGGATLVFDVELLAIEED